MPHQQAAAGLHASDPGRPSNCPVFLRLQIGEFLGEVLVPLDWWRSRSITEIRSGTISVWMIAAPQQVVGGELLDAA